MELSDLIIERRFRILHHWDWIYWRTEQGKRFRRALSVVHEYGHSSERGAKAESASAAHGFTVFTDSPEKWFKSAVL